MTQRKVYLVVWHGISPDDIYCRLYDAETHEALIGASLQYIIDAIKDRGHVLVKPPLK